VKVRDNGRPGSLNGVSEFDVALQIVSEEVALVHVLDSRADNAKLAPGKAGQNQNCSGVFDPKTLQYHDVIQYHGQTFQLHFELVNKSKLEIKLVSLTGL
jgi:hypothetical protein